MNMNIRNFIKELQYGQRGISALSALCISALLPLMAQGAAQALKVQLKNNTVQCFMLADRPVVTFSDTHCIINSASLTAEYRLADIDHAVMVEEESAVKEVAGRVLVDFTTPGRVTVRGLAAGTRLNVVSMDGRIIASVIADSDGIANIELGSVPPGVYAVNSKVITFKIHRK